MTATRRDRTCKPVLLNVRSGAVATGLMKKSFFYGLVLTVLALNLILGSQIYLSKAADQERDDAYPNIAQFTRVLEMIHQNYVDGDKVAYKALVSGALKGMITTLDPHTEYMEPRKFDDLRKDTSGEFGGLGIVISVKDTFITVVTPMDDSPGHKAGVRSGDRIVKIDGKTTEKMTVGDAVKQLRGEPGTDVTISVVRPPATAAKDYKLTRAVIKVDTVKDVNGRREFPLGENKVGYVRLTQFGEHTADDLERALKILEERGAQSLVMDLRDNPGGLLDQAVKVCEKFLPRGQLIVSTEGRNAAEKSVFNASGRNKHPNQPMVILINGGSASASEIVAGCLQDLKRAYVMGEKSFGKGSVQSILPLPDGAALRLTTAKYYTPSHKVIHEHGIEPDSVVPMSLEEERDVMLKRAPGGLDSLDEKDRERVQKARDTQLDRATDYLKGVSILLSQMKPESGKVAAK